MQAGIAAGAPQAAVAGYGVSDHLEIVFDGVAHTHSEDLHITGRIRPVADDTLLQSTDV